MLCHLEHKLDSLSHHFSLPHSIFLLLHSSPIFLLFPSPIYLIFTITCFKKQSMKRSSEGVETWTTVSCCYLFKTERLKRRVRRRERRTLSYLTSIVMMNDSFSPFLSLKKFPRTYSFDFFLLFLASSLGQQIIIIIILK